MTPLSATQLHQIRDERREQIMEAAIRTFSRYGITGTKMSMIAKEANVSQGLFYRYFTSKNELLTMLIQEAFEMSVSAIANIHSLQVSGLEKIKILTEAIIDERGKYHFLLIHQAHTYSGVPEEAKEIIKNYPVQVYIDQLLPIFKECQQKGEILDENLEELISSYLSILSGVMVINSQETSEYAIPKVDVLMRILTNKRL